MKYLRVVVLVAIVVSVAGWAAYHFGWLQNPLGKAPSTSGEPSSAEVEEGIDKNGVLSVMGWLEPSGGILNIQGPMGDRLAKLAVAEDVDVEKDQVLALLASRKVKELQADLLDSQIKEATLRRDSESELADVRICMAVSGQEKVKLKEVEAESLKKKITLLKDNLALAEKDYERLGKLRGRSMVSAQPDSLVSSDEVVSEQELDRQELLVHRAKTEWAVADSELTTLHESQKLSRTAAIDEYKAAVAGKKVAASSVPIESLKCQRKMAQAELDLTEIKAPSKGRILKIFVQEGESIGQKPILRMANVDSMVAIVEVLDVSVKRIKKNQKAVIKSGAFHEPYKDGLEGEVDSIGRVVNTPELKSLDPYARADRHVIPVRIKLKNAHCAEAASFVNMQVEVEIHTGVAGKSR